MSIPYFFFPVRSTFRGLAPAAQSSLREHEQLALRATRSVLPPHQNKKTRVHLPRACACGAKLAARARTARAPRDPLGPAATPKQKDTEPCTFRGLAPAAQSASRTNRSRSARPARSCRHTKTKRHGKSVSFCFGAPSGTRTRDPLIKSQLLYQLS